MPISKWETDRIQIMRWALRMKLINNWYTFGDLLKSTGKKIIVEDSTKDTFWGAQLVDNSFKGTNALGRLLMELREQYLEIEHKTFITLQPPQVSNFKILDNEITAIGLNVSIQLDGTNERLW